MPTGHWFDPTPWHLVSCHCSGTSMVRTFFCEPATNPSITQVPSRGKTGVGFIVGPGVAAFAAANRGVLEQLTSCITLFDPGISTGLGGATLFKQGSLPWTWPTVWLTELSPKAERATKKAMMLRFFTAPSD